MIDEKSVAGVLLREHDDAYQALRYAERKSAALLAMHNAIGLDYAVAAKQLRAAICEHERQMVAPPTWAIFAA